MRSDRGGEFTSNKFNKYYEDHGIHYPLIVPRSPKKMEWQRGRIEPYLTWLATCSKTPKEAWSERKPRIAHLRVFGSISYIQVPNQKRTKLDDRSEKYIFIGYDLRSKGYKLYNPITDKTITSRDVKFDEEDSWNWNTEEDEYDFLPYFEEEDVAEQQ
uniref:Retroviral polymerase SH3-like domain-containing protein n=1 Tax=Cannabis sativa TaxID=3483 RepID=A0A803Q910_CANSA